MTDEHPAFTANHGAPRYPMPTWYEAIVANLKSKLASGTVYTAPLNAPIPTPGFRSDHGKMPPRPGAVDAITDGIKSAQRAALGDMPEGFLEIGTLGKLVTSPADAAFRWSGIIRAGEQEHTAIVHFDATGFARDVWLALMTPPRRRGLETRSARHRRNRLRRKRAARKRTR